MASDRISSDEAHGNPDFLVQYTIGRLNQWWNATVQAWDYCVSHSILRIRLSKQYPDRTVLLYAKDCSRVSFDAGWGESIVKVESFEGKYGTRYLVTDGDRLRVDCSVIYLSQEFGSYSEVPSDPLFTPADQLDLPVEYRQAKERFLRGSE